MFLFQEKNDGQLEDQQICYSLILYLAEILTRIIRTRYNKIETKSGGRQETISFKGGLNIPI